MSVIKPDNFSHFNTFLLLPTISSQQKLSHTCLAHETQQSLHPGDTSGHLETDSENDSGNSYLSHTTWAPLFLVVFSVADTIAWFLFFLSSCLSLRSQEVRVLQYGICDLTRWRGKEMDMLFSLYPPLACKSKHTVGSGVSIAPGVCVCVLACWSQARSFMWQRHVFNCKSMFVWLLH